MKDIADQSRQRLFMAMTCFDVQTFPNGFMVLSIPSGSTLRAPAARQFWTSFAAKCCVRDRNGRSLTVTLRLNLGIELFRQSFDDAGS